MSSAVIGLDAGGTKTAAALVCDDGRVLMKTRGGPGNYHAIGLDAARTCYDEVLTPLRHEAQRVGVDVKGLAAGLSGLDRSIDAVRLRTALELVVPAVPVVVVNDTYLILRAGIEDGVGVAVVSGTGSNVVARGRDGTQHRIGGFGSEFGDDGGAGDIGRSGLRAVFRAADGRDGPTALSRLLLDGLGLSNLDDLVERFLVDSQSRGMTTAELAPFVFEAAQLGDAVCLAILEEAGQALGHAAAVVAKRCFQPEEAFGLVLGGSVFQHGVVDTMRRALISRIRREFREVTVQTLDHPPLCGAVLLALDTLMNTATETVEPAALAAALEGRT